LNGQEPIVKEIKFGENIRWHDNRFWFGDMLNGTVYSMNHDGSDKKVEFKISEGDELEKAHIGGLGWTLDN
jgi:hypothetical protein